MERETITALSVKFWGSIEIPPHNNREAFRQSVIDTVISVLKFRSITIDYIGYRPDRIGVHFLETEHAVYEDCVFLSLTITAASSSQCGIEKDCLVADIIRIFEDKTHKHIDVHSAFADEEAKRYQIELTSDWKYYRKHG